MKTKMKMKKNKNEKKIKIKMKWRVEVKLEPNLTAGILYISISKTSITDDHSK